MNFLFSIGLILVASKLLSMLSNRMHMPKVVGSLAVGILLGPTMFNIIHETDVITAIAEVGVIIIMFEAGLETNIKRFEKNIKAYIMIAVMGVIVPFLLGTGISNIFNINLMTSMFMGLVLTATSVSITVETLNEMGKLKTKVGESVLGAALIDDVLGVILLSIALGSVSSSNEDISSVLLRITAFFGFAFVIGVIFRYFFEWMGKTEGKKHRIPVLALSFCLLIAYVAERFGVADITGAYIAGLVIANTKYTEYINKKVEVLSYMIFSPVFFASIGLKAVFEGMDMRGWVFTINLVFIAIIAKIIGGVVGARLAKFNRKDAFKISVGMIARGEVALIIAAKGKNIGLINSDLFASVIVLVLVTTLVTPMLLKLIYKKDNVETVSLDSFE